VLERHVDEGSHEGRERFVLARTDGLGGSGERARVAGKCSRRATKGIARELVEHDDPGQRRVRFVGPGIELAAQRLLDGRAEVLAHRSVEGLVLDPPGSA
jgi:hypothetical protein